MAANFNQMLGQGMNTMLMMQQQTQQQTQQHAQQQAQQQIQQQAQIQQHQIQQQAHSIIGSILQRIPRATGGWRATLTVEERYGPIMQM